MWKQNDLHETLGTKKNDELKWTTTKIGDEVRFKGPCN